MTQEVVRNDGGYLATIYKNGKQQVAKELRIHTCKSGSIDVYTFEVYNSEDRHIFTVTQYSDDVVQNKVDIKYSFNYFEVSITTNNIHTDVKRYDYEGQAITKKDQSILDQ